MKKHTLYSMVIIGFIAQQVGAAGFIEDSRAQLSLCNFYFNNDDREYQESSGTNAYRGQMKEWGQGFLAKYNSGFTQGTIGVGVDALALFGVRLVSGGRVGKVGVDRTPGQLFPLKNNNKSQDFFLN